MLLRVTVWMSFRSASFAHVPRNLLFSSSCHPRIPHNCHPRMYLSGIQSKNCHPQNTHNCHPRNLLSGIQTLFLIMDSRFRGNDPSPVILSVSEESLYCHPRTLLSGIQTNFSYITNILVCLF